MISKGTRLRQAVPVSPEAIRYLTRYLDADGVPGPDEPLWRTRRGETRAVTYWAMRRVLQRANEKRRPLTLTSTRPSSLGGCVQPCS